MKTNSSVGKNTQKGAGASGSDLMQLFNTMADTVPAFKKYLREAGIKRSDIRCDDDLNKIPPTSKINYIHAYPYKELFVHGSLVHSHILTSTSGSTGEPAYFARSHRVDEQSAAIHERFFNGNSLSKEVPTLVVVCFGMGVWIGGIITYQAFEMLGKRGLPLSVITPGINQNEILKILSKLAPQYRQVILAGYPPFIKDILDAVRHEKISLRRCRIGIVCAAEAFTENFRDYLAKAAHVRNPLTDIMNIYGSADLGTMAFETPLSVLIRRLAARDPAFFKGIFGNISKTPTLAQFIPSYTHFAEDGGQLLVSGMSAMPLIRYAIGDNGGVHTLDSIKKIARRHRIDLQKEMEVAHISPDDAQLPFVYVYERIDLSTTLYGLQIYPETIKDVLIEKSFAPFTTGRLALAAKYDDEHNQYLEINIELHKGKSASRAFSSRLLAEIVRTLKSKNAEYRELARFLSERAEPRLVFRAHEDPTYFRRDIKQKWVVRKERH